MTVRPYFSSGPGDREQLRNRAIQDGAIIVALGVLLFFLSKQFHLFARIVEWVARNESWELDDILTMALYGAAASAVFIFRRRNELLDQLRQRERTEADRARLVPELERALAEVKTLSGMLPICAWCKKIRDDNGYWNRLEEYIEEHTAAEFTHGICPDCAVRVHGKSDADGLSQE